MDTVEHILDLWIDGFMLGDFKDWWAQYIKLSKEDNTMAKAMKSKANKDKVSMKAKAREVEEEDEDMEELDEEEDLEEEDEEDIDDTDTDTEDDDDEEEEPVRKSKKVKAKAEPEEEDDEDEESDDSDIEDSEEDDEETEDDEDEDDSDEDEEDSDSDEEDDETDVEVEEDDEEEEEKPKKKARPEKANPPSKNTISYTVFRYLTDLNNKKPSLDAITAIVKKRHPDSKFNESHLNWYRNHFVKRVGVKINMPLETPEHRKERMVATLKKARAAMKEKNPVMYAKTLPSKERKKFIRDLDPKTKKLVLKGLAKASKSREED